jgi:PadR family transcriptional regulator PadR
MNTQFNKGVIEMCVLALVSQRDYYGYELVERISQKIEISEGTIYPILRRLTQEKYFDTYLKESNEGPPRKYYRITPAAKEMTEKLLGDWSQFKKNVDFILTAEEGAKK